MIERREVKSLNNEGNFSLEFNEDLNIITGANGSGKTTLLKLIWYLISGQLERVLDIVISGQLERVLDIKLQSISIKTNQFALSIVLKDHNEGKFQIGWSVSELDRYDNPSQDIPYDESQDIPYDEWQDIPYGQAKDDCRSLNENIAERMESSLFFPSFRRIEGGFSRIPQQPSSARLPRRTSSSGRAQTIEENPFRDTIPKFAEARSVGNHKFVASFSMTDIAELVPQKDSEISKKIDAIYADLSRDLKEKIPSELETALEIQEANSVLEQIHEKLDEAASEEQELRNPLKALHESVDAILKARIEITKEITLGEGSDVKLANQLSYGEQQLLSFLCYNAFSSDTVIFIDEPELSLHVDWQRSLLPHLLEQRTGNQFFIATHSPFIYAKYPDEEILLGDDRGGEI